MMLIRNQHFESVFSEKGFLFFAIFTTLNPVVRLFILCLLFFVAVETDAQKFLALDKGGHVKRLRFYAGDAFHFIPVGSSHYIDGVIDVIGDSVIISGKAYAPADIKKVKVYRSEYTVHLLQSGMINFGIFGLLYLTACGVSASNQGDTPLITGGQMSVAAGLFLMVPIFYRLTYRTFNTEKKHPLKIMDVRPM